MPPDPPPTPTLKIDQRDNLTTTTALPALNTHVKLTMGTLWFKGSPPDESIHAFSFQFNPTEIERTRAIDITRSKTGNTLEEQHGPARNQAKHKQTRKPLPWEMTLTLQYDASYPFPKIDKNSKPTTPVYRNPANPNADQPDAPPAAPFLKDNLEQARIFFESLVEPRPFKPEVEKTADADETPPPPDVYLNFGPRTWKVFVKSLRIKEEDYTFDLYPRRLTITLTLEALETIQQNESGKTGGNS